MRRKAGAADELQDDFDLDESLVAASNDEGSNGDDDYGDGDKEPRPDGEASAKKRQRKKRRKVAAAAAAAGLGAGRGPGVFAVPRDASEQAALWNEHLRKAYPGLTRLELGDIALQSQHVQAADADRDASLEALARAAVAAGDKGKDKGKAAAAPGAPLVLVVCSSALRVVDLVRRLRPVSRRPVAKLFSRHIKVEAHKAMLAGAAVDVAVGTPNRIRRLLADGDLALRRLRLVAIDCWQDTKMRVVLDMDDTRADLFAMWRDILLPALKQPDCSFKLRLVAP
ncbi:Protein cms1 [Coemansia javaensis]|uniref:Protein cms1 n=1 Tax=Coemansia javaensis TaxID=2761396 RepID=A0A9W8LGV4_9FUNG|nr:Protein cms1 [Coemansia javaensis]